MPMMNVDAAEEVQLVSGFVLAEREFSGELVWHRIACNLASPEWPNAVDWHKTECGQKLHGVAHDEMLGHDRCEACFEK